VTVATYHFRGATFEAEAYTRNDFEDEEEVRERWWQIQPGQVVLDVGAAIGSYVLPALALGAEVVALCPQRVHAGLLSENLARNPGFAERCTIYSFGLYDREGWLWCDGSYHFSEEYPAPDKVNDEMLRVVPLDSMAHLIPPRLDWVKLDVEGAEVLALRGAEQVLRRLRPRVLVENHLFMDPGIAAEVAAFMMGLGYSGESHPYSRGNISHSLFQVMG
jgi:FkbM family methyltransferase